MAVYLEYRGPLSLAGEPILISSRTTPWPRAPDGQHVARLLTDSTPEGDGLLLVGGIDYGPHGKWNRLPGTAEEVQQLEQLRPGARTVRLEGEDATKARLQQLLPGRRYVHLATHGEFLDPGSRNDRARFRGVDSTSGGAVFDVTARNPLLLSMLILAGANRPVPTDARGLPVGSDSFLTAEEVMGMDLTRTELVVLSACETGLGKVRGSEGVFSLQRAFHISGSCAVVASLWQIPDKATQVLMHRFYENLWRKKMSKLEALRETQIWMLREGAKEPDLVRGLRRLPEETQETKGAVCRPFTGPLSRCRVTGAETPISIVPSRRGAVMSRPYSAFRILGYAAVIVAGLGIGFWAARRWSANPPRSQESSATDSPASRPIARLNSTERLNKTIGPRRKAPANMPC